MRESKIQNRREFVERIATTALAVGVGATITPWALGADEIKAMRAASAPGPAIKPDNSWLEGIRGNHSQIFDMPIPTGGLGLLHVRNYIHTYRSAFGQSYPHVLAIVGLYGATTVLAFNDAMWAKYGFGAAIRVNDRETKAPVVRNVFATAPADGLLGAEARIDIPGDSSISALQSLGARFIVCNNAFNLWVGRLASVHNRPAAEIRAELDANMLPKVTIVPAMVIAMNQAQHAGASYMFLEEGDNYSPGRSTASLRAFPNGRPSRWRRPHRAVQLAVGAKARRQNAAADRGYGQGAQHRRKHAGDLRWPRMARPRLGR